MATGVTYLVFLLPIVFSFVFGGAVLGQVLQEPDRELNMMQFGSHLGLELSQVNQFKF